MSVEDKLIQKTMSIPRRINLTENQKEQIVRNYVPVVMQHIRDHGCSGLKCKRCPLNNLCDRNASKSKELAAQVIAYANTTRAKNGV